MRHLFYLVSVLITVACGSKSSSDSDTAASNPFAGTFSGTESGTQNGTAFSQTVSFTLTQTANAIGGTWTSQSGGTGTVSGTAAGSTISDLKITETDTVCIGTLTGTMSISGTQLTSSFTGILVGCGNVTATVTATKQ